LRVGDAPLPIRIEVDRQSQCPLLVFNGHRSCGTERPLSGESGHDECTGKYPLMTQSGREADDLLRYLKVGVVSGLIPGGP
jgi:hypothetical protein